MRSFRIILSLIILTIGLNTTAQKDLSQWPHIFNDANYQYGMIDNEGNIILSPRYDFIQDFNRPNKYEVHTFEELNNTVYRDSSNKIGLLDKFGKILFEPRPYLSISFHIVIDSLTNEKYAVYHEGRKLGCLDEKGKVVIPPTFHRLHLFENLKTGLAPAAINGNYGYVDKLGTFIIPNRFDNAFPFNYGKAWVQHNKKWGVINRKGELILNCQFDYGHSFNENGIAAAKLNNKWGFINVYDKLEALAFGLSLVRKDKKVGFVNSNGKLVIDTIYDGARSFQSEDRAIFFSNRKWGYIDNTGKICIPAIYDLAKPFHESELAIVKDSTHFWMIDKEGNKKQGPFPFLIFPFRESDVAVFQTHDGRQKLNGIINKNGKIILDPIPAKIEPFRQLNYAQVHFGKRIGLVNKKGEFFGFTLEDIEAELAKED